MFNLNNVYACVHLDENNISILVLCYSKHGVPQYLYSHVDDFIPFNSEWEEKTKKIIQTAEEKLNLKFTRLLVSINSNLVKEVKTKKIKLEKIVFSNITDVLEECHQKLKFHMKNNRFKSYYFSDTKLLQVSDNNNKNIPLKNIKPGELISLTWQVTYCDSKTFAPIINLLGKMNIDLLGINMSNENLPSLVENKVQNNALIVVIGKSQSNLFSVNNGAIFDLQTMNYCVDEMVKYVKQECITKNVLFDEKKIYKILKQSTLIYACGVSDANVFCETDDQFLSLGFIKTNNIYNFCCKYTTQLINFVNNYAIELKQKKKNEKINVYLVITDEFYKHILSDIISKIKNDQIRYHILGFNLIINNDQRLIMSFAAITNLIENQKLANKYEYSIDPYYSEEYESIAERKINRLRMEKTMNILIQKLVK